MTLARPLLAGIPGRRLLPGKAATEVAAFKAGDHVVLKSRNGEILSINAEGRTKKSK